MDRKPTPITDLLGVLLAGWLMFGGHLPAFPLSPFVEPPPFKAQKLCVLVLEDTKQRGAISPGQLEAMTANGPASVRGYVASKQGDYLIWSKDQPPTKDSPAWVADALKVANRDKLPWIVAATPSTGTSRELPKEAAETIAALKKIGGP